MTKARIIQAATKAGVSPQVIDDLRRSLPEDKPQEEAWDITDWLTFDELVGYENFGGTTKEFWARRDPLEALARARYITAKKAKRAGSNTQDVPRVVKGEFRIIGGPLATR